MLLCIMLAELLHGEEARVWGGSVYAGQAQTIDDHAPGARGFTEDKSSRNCQLTEEEWARNRNKSRVRAKVEPQLAIVKRQSGTSRVRYRGLGINAHRLCVACALSNLVISGKTLQRRVRPGLRAVPAIQGRG